MTNEPGENELVRECLGGDEHAFEILLRRFQGPVFNAILRMVRDRDEAADLTQTAFLKAYEQLSSFDPRHKFFSWLYRIAVNEALNHISGVGGRNRSTASGFLRLAHRKTPSSGRTSASTCRTLS